MNTSHKKIILWLVIIIVFIVGIFYCSKLVRQNTTQVSTASSIAGCYIAHLSKDVYTLTIDNQVGNSITGQLSFKNFEKDSSSGTFAGTYTDGILLGNYTFNSEGMSSVRQVIFKKIDTGFVEGFGDVKTEGDTESFVDVTKVTYDPNSTFVSSADCNTSLDMTAGITYVNATSDDVAIDSPLPGAMVGSNFTVKGSVRGPWYFEASFPIQVLDTAGKVIYSAPVQAGGDWMVPEFVPFQADIKLPDSYKGLATIVLKKDNPSDVAAHDASVSLPITVK